MPEQHTNDPRHQGTIDTAGQPDRQDTDPAEERGERISTGRQIARGGKGQGHVEGATGEKNEPRSGNP